MKKFVLIIACCLFTGTVAYVCGYHNRESEAYRAACAMSDALRCIYDHLEEDSVLKIGDYEDITYGLLIDYKTDLDIDLSKYSACY